MFGRKKQENREEIRNDLAELKRGQEDLTQALKELEQRVAVCGERIDVLGKDTGKQLRRHSEAIEDLLEERSSQEAIAENCERQIKEGTERENMLLGLLCRYQEEFGVLEEKLCLKEPNREYAEGWSKQFALFKKSVESELRRCSIEETGRPGEAVDYHYHEILDTEDIKDAELEGTIAHCYRSGCIYHGKVITKAQVRVYRRKKEE